jgi:hypothetical protein
VNISGGRQQTEDWAKQYLEKPAHSNLLQCLNAIENLQSWTGAGYTNYLLGYPTGQKRVYHVSSGKVGTSQTCTLLFYQENQDTAYVFAVAQHINSDTYEILGHRATTCDIPKKIRLGKQDVVISCR